MLCRVLAYLGVFIEISLIVLIAVSSVSNTAAALSSKSVLSSAFAGAPPLTGTVTVSTRLGAPWVS